MSPQYLYRYCEIHCDISIDIVATIKHKLCIRESAQCESLQKPTNSTPGIIAQYGIETISRVIYRTIVGIRVRIYDDLKALLYNTVVCILISKDLNEYYL